VQLPLVLLVVGYLLQVGSGDSRDLDAAAAPDSLVLTLLTKRVHARGLQLPTQHRSSDTSPSRYYCCCSSSSDAC
jgi:hypothetical protein